MVVCVTSIAWYGTLDSAGGGVVADGDAASGALISLSLGSQKRLASLNHWPPTSTAFLTASVAPDQSRNIPTFLK